jgi:competence protein ComEC
LPPATRETLADIRLLAVSAAAWLGALAGAAAYRLPLWGALLVLTVPAVAVLAPVSLGVTAARSRTWALWAAVLFLVGAETVLRLAAVATSDVATEARSRPVVVAQVRISGDPVVRQGQFGPMVVVSARTVRVEVRGRVLAEQVPVVLLGDPGDDDWSQVALGTQARLTARLAPSDEPGTAAVLSVLGAPTVVRAPPAVLRAAGGVRASVREAARGGAASAAALVPALVTGDDAGLSEELEEDFRTTGLTHLTAVSGTNLTLVLGFLLVLARGVGVRARGLLVVGLVGVVGFVLLARPEPSVLRAAVMGSVALLGLQAGSRAAGTRALGAATAGLLVVEPSLASSAGFALSVLATGGILLVGPRLREALAGWLPRAWAEAVAVPLAAQLACTPLVAGLSGQVSLVAVVANLVVAPVVGPATVLGLLGGLVGLAVPAVGGVAGRVACWCAWWIVAVAQHGAALPTAAVAWPAGLVGLTLLTVICLVTLGRADRLLRRRGPALTTSVLLVAVIVVPAPDLSWVTGWPPRGWVLVMCDVGQGDSLVLAAGHHAAVVVDAGPDPRLVDGCLRRLGVQQVPELVLTHFHADHVDGLPGVLRHRSVGEVVASPLREPGSGVAEVSRWTSEAGIPVRTPPVGERAGVGPLRWTVLSPAHLLSDSPNDSSLVLLVETRGIRILLTGDVEPPSQEVLEREGIGPVDVLKVPHHGSRYQDPALLTGLGARVALVSVGEDNDYGHPAASTLALLQHAGMVVRRTDRDGDVAVVVVGHTLRVVSRE